MRALDDLIDLPVDSDLIDVFNTNLQLIKQHFQLLTGNPSVLRRGLKEAA